MAARHLWAVLALLLASWAVPAHAQQSADRKSILDALRREGDAPDRVFVVRYLKAQGGWAWVVADPRSRDGSSRYETESALLRSAAGIWKVVDRPCEEDGCDPKREVARIRAAHPETPAAVFPR